jgi:hypothetical protein
MFFCSLERKKCCDCGGREKGTVVLSASGIAIVCASRDVNCGGEKLDQKGRCCSTKISLWNFGYILGVMFASVSLKGVKCA